MSKNVFAVAAMIVTLLLGGVGGAYLIDHFRVLEVPNRFIEQEADGARVRFIYFNPLHALGPNEERKMVIVFYDWKNNGGERQITYRSHNSWSDDRIFYSDEDMISALVDGHVLFNYDKKTRTITKKDFGSTYTLIKPSPDWERILAWEGGDIRTGVAVMDGSGRVLKGNEVPDFMPEDATFIDGHRRVEIKTNPGGDVPSAYYVWDLETNELTKTDRVDPRQPSSLRTGSASLFGILERIPPMEKETKEVTFRLVDWVQGQQSQEQAALEVGRCTLQSLESNECLNNPFFIRNTEKRLTLPVANDVRMYVYARNGGDGMVANAEGNIYLEPISITSFLDLYKREQAFKFIPFIFTTTNGVVTQIEEQYVP